MVTLYDANGQPLVLRRNGLMMELAQTERMKKMIIELAQMTQQLTKKDIAAWRRAWQMAIDVDYPRRIELYNIYTDVEIDNHLSGIVEQLTNSVISRSFKVYDINTGKEVAELTLLLEDEWFKDLMKYILQARYWGHSLIQLGDIVTSSIGRRRFSSVELIPRQHVVPEFGLILKDVYDDYSKGIPYREGKISQWLIEAGKPKDLGLYLKCAPQAISKKNMMAFWDQFGEMFGMPIRIAKTNTTDPKERGRLEQMLTNMGAAAWGLFPDGTEIDIRETSRGDAFEVYDRRIDRANTEMSKAVLTVTMTADDGSSRSQSEVHERMLQLTIEQQADWLKDVINNQLLPRLIALGFPFTEKHYFNWDYAIDYTPEQQLEIEKMLLTYFEVDEQYFVEKYNVPVKGRINQNPQLGFFGQAPHISGASDW